MASVPRYESDCAEAVRIEDDDIAPTRGGDGNSAGAKEGARSHGSVALLTAGRYDAMNVPATPSPPAQHNPAPASWSAAASLAICRSVTV